jgi:hypothetical protein
MKLYKVKEGTVLIKYNPDKKNMYGGIGAEVVKLLNKDEIVLINRIEPNILEKSTIKADNYYTSKNNFIVVSEYVNPLTDKVSTKDISKFAYKKIKEPKTLIILGILGAVVIGLKAIIKKN